MISGLLHCSGNILLLDQPVAGWLDRSDSFSCISLPNASMDFLCHTVHPVQYTVSHQR